MQMIGSFEERETRRRTGATFPASAPLTPSVQSRTTASV